MFVHSLLWRGTKPWFTCWKNEYTMVNCSQCIFGIVENNLVWNHHSKNTPINQKGNHKFHYIRRWVQSKIQKLCHHRCNMERRWNRKVFLWAVSVQLILLKEIWNEINYFNSLSHFAFKIVPWTIRSTCISLSFRVQNKLHVWS